MSLNQSLTNISTNNQFPNPGLPEETEKTKVKRFFGFIIRHAFIFGLMLLSLATLMECFPELLHLKFDPAIHSLYAFMQVFIHKFAEVLIVFAIGTLALESKHFLQYTIKRIEEVMNTNESLKKMSNERKIEAWNFLAGLLRQEFQKFKIKERNEYWEKFGALFYPDEALEKDGFFQTVHENIIPMMDNYYYQQHSSNIHIEIIDREGRKYIKKNIHKHIVFGHMSGKVEKYETISAVVFLKEYYRKDDTFKLNMFNVNGKRLIDQVVKIETEYAEDGIERKKVILECPECEVANGTIINLEYETIVPIDDCIFTSRLNVPCKKYSIRLTFDEKKSNINSFDFHFVGGQEKVKLPNSIYTEFKGWTLPGFGTGFIITSK